MIECPRCTAMVDAGILPSCPLCDSTRTVSDEVFLRWKFRRVPHRWLTFDGTPVCVAVTDTFEGFRDEL